MYRRLRRRVPLDGLPGEASFAERLIFYGLLFFNGVATRRLCRRRVRCSRVRSICYMCQCVYKLPDDFRFLKISGSCGERIMKLVLLIHRGRSEFLFFR